MRIEIDFGSGGDPRRVRRWVVLALPAVLLVLILFLWLEPILSTLAPFALAFVFAYLLNPVVDFLSGENRKKWRMHRGFALLILFLVLLLAVLGILGVVIPSIAEEAAEFGRKMRDEVLPIIRERVGERREVWLPYTQAEFWVDLYTRYQAHFTFENLVKVLTYGWQGAGAVAERAGGSLVLAFGGGRRVRFFPGLLFPRGGHHVLHAPRFRSFQEELLQPGPG